MRLNVYFEKFQKKNKFHFSVLIAFLRIWSAKGFSKKSFLSPSALLGELKPPCPDLTGGGTTKKATPEPTGGLAVTYRPKQCSRPMWTCE